jgi:fumigallin biosynthesis monooxygenase-like protein
MIRNERLAAAVDGTFVVFLIGMRVNRLWRIDKWWPVATAMPRMIRELAQQPQTGFLHAETWFGRTTIMLQYWRSLEQLLAYARDKDGAHLPAWRAFNRAVGVDGSVGIWHETYVANPGTYENIYVNMPAFGLAKAGTVYPATGGRQFAAARMAADRDP